MSGLITQLNKKTELHQYNNPGIIWMSSTYDVYIQKCT